MQLKQIKQELRKLKKIKKDLRKGSSEYKEIKNKIKELKIQKETLLENNPEKDKLIKEINKLTPNYLVGIINLNDYSKEQLEKHLNKLKERGKNVF